MSDPNADLIGYTFAVENGLAEVTGSAKWDSNYMAVTIVNVEGVESFSVRSTALIRARIAIEASQAEVD